MAFCNACGTALTGGARFCAKCGAPILTSSPELPPRSAAPTAQPGAAASPAPAPASNAVKIVLIVVGAFLLLGIIGAVSVGMFLHRMAGRTHIQQNGDNVKVETPFGTVETTKDPQEAARNLGVDIYPGAEVEKEGSSATVVGGVHSVALTAQTSDSPDKVCGFYQPKFPNAMVVSKGDNQCTIVSNDAKNMITINAKVENGKTRISITDVNKAGETKANSN